MFSKKKNYRDNLKKNIKKEKNYVEKHCNKTKTMWGNTVTIDNISKKKTIMLNSQPIQ